MATRRGAGFGQWLDLTLKDKGINGRELAALVGVHESVISKWKTGAREPKPRELSRLAQVLEVDQFRLIVTAGLMEPTDGVEPLPLPAEDPQRKALRKALQSAPGMHDELLQQLLETYDRDRRRRSAGNGGPVH